MVRIRAFSSLTSSLLLVNGRLLTIFSASHNTVCNMSSVIIGEEVKSASNTLRTTLIMRSHIPPWWEASGGLNVQSTFCLLAASTMLSWFTCCKQRFNSAWPPTRFVPLSDQTFWGVPLLVTNPINALINVSVSRLTGISRWIALVLKQVNTQPYLFTCDRPILT